MHLDKSMYPDRIIPEIKLSELLNFDAVRSLMESFYNITGVPMSLIDLEGNLYFWPAPDGRTSA